MYRFSSTQGFSGFGSLSATSIYSLYDTSTLAPPSAESSINQLVDAIEKAGAAADTEAKKKEDAENAAKKKKMLIIGGVAAAVLVVGAVALSKKK